MLSRYKLDDASAETLQCFWQSLWMPMIKSLKNLSTRLPWLHQSISSNNGAMTKISSTVSLAVMHACIIESVVSRTKFDLHLHYMCKYFWNLDQKARPIIQGMTANSDEQWRK